MSSKEIKNIGLGTLIVFGTAATVTAVVLCVKKAKTKKSKETLTAEKIIERQQLRGFVYREQKS